MTESALQEVQDCPLSCGARFAPQLIFNLVDDGQGWICPQCSGVVHVCGQCNTVIDTVRAIDTRQCPSCGVARHRMSWTHKGDQ
jgi:DNA-directed RNA polymerase subunit RPC12/RpoP